MKILLLFNLIFLSISSSANEKLVVLDQRFYNQKVRIEVGEKDNDQITYLYLNNKLLKEWERSIVNEKLTRVELMKKKNLLFLFWPKGAHGEQLAAFDYKNNKIIWEHRSAWPYKINQDEDKLSVIYSNGLNSKGDPVEITKTF